MQNVLSQLTERVDITLRAFFFFLRFGVRYKEKCEYDQVIIFKIHLRVADI